MINQYGYFKVSYIDENKFPKWNGSRWINVENLKDGTVLLSKTRCKALKVPVGEGEKPAAYRIVKNGYCGLYDRTDMVGKDKLFSSEIFKI